MAKLLKELTDDQRTKIKELIVNSGFMIDVYNKTRIEFSHGFRKFTLQSLDLSDKEFGLAMSIDLDSFLKKNYIYKEKYSLNLQDKIETQSLLTDEACSVLNWVVVDHIPLDNIQMEEYSEDPVAENIYQVLIRNVNHIIVDDSVFEGNIGSLRQFISLKMEDFFKDKNLTSFVEQLKKI